MTSNPNHQGDHADHGQHHSKGDSGVCGDGVEKEVDYGWHGGSEAPASVMDRDWNKTDGNLSNSQMRNFCSKFKTHFNHLLHYSLHTMGPILPAILISLCSDDSDKLPHCPPPEGDIHNKQSLMLAKVTAGGTAHLDRSRARSITQAGATQ